MSAAQFEEREYERPLYHELRASQNRLWSPGQVLEKRVGFDTAFFAMQPFPLQLFGPDLPPGIVPSWHWQFFRHELHVPPHRRLPNFSLNVFLQAKRPRYLTSSSQAIASKGVRGAHWAFRIDKNQQLVLEKLQAKLAGKAIVTYAAPVFHTEKQLYKHTIGGTVANHSTYPVPTRMSGHDHWHYKVPGAVGVAKSEPEAVEDLPLETRIAELGRGESVSRPEEDWIGNLRALSRDIREVMVDAELVESLSRARYFVLTREIDTDTGEGLPPWASPYLKITAFLWAFRLCWFCVE